MTGLLDLCCYRPGHSRTVIDGNCTRYLNHRGDISSEEDIVVRANPHRVFQVQHLLGEGETSQVFSVCDRRDFVLLAAKVIDIRGSEADESVRRRFLREALNQFRCSHPNIAKCYGCFEEVGWTSWWPVVSHKLWIVQELVPHGTLEGWLSTNFPPRKHKNNHTTQPPPPLPLNETLGSIVENDHTSTGMGPAKEKQIAIWLTQLLSALSTLHNQHRILFRDLKTANIGLDQDFNMRIVDFGSTTTLPHQQDSILEDAIVGSPEYIAPECWASIYSFKTDIWSLGVVAYELGYGYSPFYWVASLVGKLLQDVSTLEEEQKAEKTKEKASEIRMMTAEFSIPFPTHPTGDTFSVEYVDFVQSLLHPIASKRLSIDQALAHPFIASNCIPTLPSTPYENKANASVNRQQKEINQQLKSSVDEKVDKVSPPPEPEEEKTVVQEDNGSSKLESKELEALSEHSSGSAVSPRPGASPVSF